MTGGGRGGLALSGGTGPVGVRARPGGDGQRGAQRVSRRASGGYLGQPDMRRLMAAALELGWSLWAYEAVFEITADSDPAQYRTMEFTNWREREQAASLGRLDRGRRPSRCWSGAATATPARTRSATGSRWDGITGPCPAPNRSSSTRP